MKRAFFTKLFLIASLWDLAAAGVGFCLYKAIGRQAELKKFYCMRLLLPLVLTLLSISALGQVTWEQVKSDSNVTVYTRQEPGRAYKSFKAVGLVPAAPEDLLHILEDVNSYNKWFAFSKSVRLLNNQHNKKHIYMETRFPWPFSNEDMVFIMSVKKISNDDIKFSLGGRPDYLPTIAGVKRMRSANGYILLQPVDEDTLVTYEMNTELSGAIAPWLANKYIHLMPFQTLNSLIEIVAAI
jgi:hypothetical protein